MIALVEPNTIHERISALIDYFCKGNKTAFGRETDILPGVLASITGGRLSKPSFELLQKIMTRYPAVSGNWLVLGRGQMLVSGIATGDTGSQESEPQPQSASALLVKQIKQEIEAISVQLADTQRTLEIFRREDEKLAEKAYMFKSRGRDSITEEDREQYNQLAAQTATLRELGQPYKIQAQAYAQQLAEKQEEYLKAIRLEAQDSQNSLYTVYRVEGDSDATRQYGGLLSQRLNISIESAMTLILTGKIRSIHIESEGYRVSEQAVREFLGEA